MGIEALVGKVIIKIDSSWDELLFHCADDTHYRMYHAQDCCESVSVEDICGDLDDLLLSPVIKAEEVVKSPQYLTIMERLQIAAKNRDMTIEQLVAARLIGAALEIEVGESETWTFYKIDTLKGGVTIRWYGTSNGYYSETVDFEVIE